MRRALLPLLAGLALAVAVASCGSPALSEEEAREAAVAAVAGDALVTEDVPIDQEALDRAIEKMRDEAEEAGGTLATTESATPVPGETTSVPLTTIHEASVTASISGQHTPRVDRVNDRVAVVWVPIGDRDAKVVVHEDHGEVSATVVASRRR